MSVETRLLERIIPPDSIICLAERRQRPTKGRRVIPWNHIFIKPSPQQWEQVRQALEKRSAYGDTDLYFAVAGYQHVAGKDLARDRAHVAGLKCLLLDIDVKAEGDDTYCTSKKEALQRLQHLCREADFLPKPWVVDSGFGIHAYFELDEVLDPQDWARLAGRFAELVRRVEPKLLADPKRTRDMASVMRVPGTANTKQEGVQARFLLAGSAGSAEAIRKQLGAQAGSAAAFLDQPKPDYAEAEGDEAARLGSNSLADLPLKPILTGCAQMRRVCVKKGDVPEPEWLLMLRVLATTKRAEDAAQFFSSGHPKYSQGETARKLAHVRTHFEAPSAGCQEFEMTCHPELCKACQYRGKIWSPSQLGLIPVKAQREEQAVEQARQKAQKVVAQAADQTDVELPLPEFYKQSTTMSGEEITLLPVKLKDNPGYEKGLIKAHITVRRGSIEVVDMPDPTGGVRKTQRDLRVHLDVRVRNQTIRVSVPAAELTTERLDTATKALRDIGVTFLHESPNEAAAVRMFLRHVTEITTLGKPVPHWPDKGWLEAYPRYKRPLVLGARRFEPDGTVEIGCTSGDHTGTASETFVESFCSGRPVGDLAKWQQGMEIYNRPGMELTKMLLLSGVSNMLLPIVSNQKGGILLVLTGRSGVGKTTLLRFLGSFIGNPDLCMVPGSSTPNALVNMLKQSQFFMLPVDDTLKLDAEQLSLLLTSVSSGMERMRLTAGSNTGVFTAEWKRPFYSSLLATSNYSMESVIGTGGANAAQLQTDAALSRLLEIPAHVIKLAGSTRQDWLTAERLIAENHGHAAPLLASYLVKNQKKVSIMADKMRVMLEETLLHNTPLSEQGVARFWARFLTCIGLTGKILCDELGALPWDYRKILRTAVGFVTKHHEGVEETRRVIAETFWSLLTDNQDGRIRINYSYQWAENSKDWPAWDDFERKAQQRRRYDTQWDTQAMGQLLLSNLNISAPPTAVNLMNQPHRWRVILTSLKDADGRVLSIERQVLIPLNILQDLVDRNARLMRVSGWEELYYNLQMDGVSVKGVRPESPTSYGRGIDQMRGNIDETKDGKGETRHAVRIVFPPLPGSVLQPDQADST